MAADLIARGADCWFAASTQAARMIRPSFGGHIIELRESMGDNQATWRNAITTFRPDAIVFADYPLLFFSSGAVPLADSKWVTELEAFAGMLFTLDHTGYAQRRQIVYFGPPHLTFAAERTVDLPERMEILLPCPTHEPCVVPDQKGVPIRYWLPARPSTEAQVRQVRSQYLSGDDGILVFHSTPAWALRLAGQLRLPHYRFLSSILEHYFAEFGCRITIVSVNDGALLESSQNPTVRFVNLPTLDPVEYDALLAAADLMLTDNAVSLSLAKAACSLTPCAVLRNSFRLIQLLERERDRVTEFALAMENERPGAIFPYDVFPLWDEGALHELGFQYAGSYGQTFTRLELFGGESTRATIAALLFDTATRSNLRSSQSRYVLRVAALPSGADVIVARVRGL